MKMKVKRYIERRDVTNVPLWALEYVPLDGLKTVGDRTYALFITEVFVS